jgi:hypothetical protein
MGVHSGMAARAAASGRAMPWFLVALFERHSIWR